MKKSLVTQRVCGKIQREITDLSLSDSQPSLNGRNHSTTVWVTAAWLITNERDLIGFSEHRAPAISYRALQVLPLEVLQRCSWTSIIHSSDIKSESLVGCLLKSWPVHSLIKLIHGFNKWGTGSRCACWCVWGGARRASITLIGHLLLLLSASFSPDPCRCGGL